MVLNYLDVCARNFWTLTSCLFLLCCQTSYAQRNLKDIPPPDPELERKSFQVADGFEVNLYAADPRIAKPIQMNFDPEGRLWVVSSEIYPHIKPGQKANDKVLILEDKDLDGVAETTKVFAEGLLIPTGIVPGNQGAYVANSTQLLHFVDHNGDDKADEKRIVLSGFGTEDTHHILHTLRWGPDGLMYFNQSIYIHSHIETPWGVKRLNGGGIWQFRPETLQLDVYLRGLVNTWGHHFDQWGQSFATDGAGGEGINYVVPGAAYVTAVGVPRILHGLNPGSPKYCGLEVISGRHLPDDWQGNLITNDFRGHRVCRYVLEESQSGYIAKQQKELIKSSHVAFRPIDVKMGPDGAIYIADWYNPIIQHGEVDFRDPRRDHVHGRIWRVTAKNRKSIPKLDLKAMKNYELFALLQAPEQWTRHAVKRVLKERGPEVLKDLKNWVKNLDSKDKQFEHHLLEALWVWHSFDVLNEEILNSLLASSDHHVRAAATRLLTHWHRRFSRTEAVLERLITDEHPQVRLEAIRILGRIQKPRSMEIALRALDFPVDENIDYALWLTARELQHVWLPALKSGSNLVRTDARKLAFALSAIGKNEAASALNPLLKQLKNNEIAAEQRSEVYSVVAQLGDPAALAVLFQTAIKNETPQPIQIQLLSELANVTRSRRIRPAGDLNNLAKHLHSDNASLVQVAVECAGLWQLQPLRTELARIVKDDQSSTRLQHKALNSLASLGGTESGKLFRELTEPGQPLETTIAAHLAWTHMNPTASVKQVERILNRKVSEEQAALIFQAYLAHKQGAKLLAESLKEKTLPVDMAKLGLRIISSSGRTAPQLEEVLRTAGKISSGAIELTKQELVQLADQVKQVGDPVKGELVYRRADLQCMKCHAIGGAGGRVGPDLISIGASAQIDYLLQSLLQPNKKIKENYQTLVVATLDGKVTTGIKIRETKEQLTLRDIHDQLVQIPRKQIDEMTNGSSMMPAGLTEKITNAELIDLVSFLSHLGRDSRYQISRTPFVRRWRMMKATPEASYRLRRTRYGQATTDDAAFVWEPIYSTVGSSLPLSDLQEIRVRNRVAAGDRGVAFLRFDLEVIQAGEIRLKLNSADGLTIWANEQPVDSSDVLQLTLPQGTHRITLAVDLQKRSNPIQIQQDESFKTKARIRFVTGK